MIRNHINERTCSFNECRGSCTINRLKGVACNSIDITEKHLVDGLSVRFRHFHLHDCSCITKTVILVCKEHCGFAKIELACNGLRLGVHMLERRLGGVWKRSVFWKSDCFTGLSVTTRHPLFSHGFLGMIEKALNSWLSCDQTFRPKIALYVPAVVDMRGESAFSKSVRSKTNQIGLLLPHNTCFQDLQLFGYILVPFFITPYFVKVLFSSQCSHCQCFGCSPSVEIRSHLSELLMGWDTNSSGVRRGEEMLTFGFQRFQS